MYRRIGPTNAIYENSQHPITQESCLHLLNIYNKRKLAECIVLKYNPLVGVKSVQTSTDL